MTSQIYKITYPNGKIYIGSDLTADLLYFGSPSRNQIEKDFSPFPTSFTITKEILWQSDTLTSIEVKQREMDFIRVLGANDPDIGYNLLPKLKKIP